MKYLQNTLFCLLLLLSMSSVYAQNVPSGMKYQAVARNTSGEILPNKNLTLKIELKNGEQSYYVEEHQIKTNQIGLFDLVVGGGKPSKGNFEIVPWSTNDIWMAVSIKDNDKDKNFTAISESKLLAVPYAFHAVTASKLTENESSPNAVNFRNNNGIPSEVWSLKGNRNTDAGKDRLGTTDLEDLILITNNLERLRISSDGKINIQEDLTVEKDVAIGNDLYVNRNVYLNTTAGGTINNGPFEVSNGSPTYLSGSLGVDMETQLRSALSVGGNTFLEKKLTVQEGTELNDYLVVDGNTTLLSQLFVSNNAPTILTGDLSVDQNVEVRGDAKIQGNTNIDGGLIVEQNSWLNGQTIIDYFPGTNNQGDASLYSHNLIVQGNLQGMAVKLEASTPLPGNNFITFFNRNNAPLGRIEGSGGIVNGLRAAVISLVAQPSFDEAKVLSQDKNQAPDVSIPGGAADYFLSGYAYGAYDQTLELVGDIIRFVINVAVAIATGCVGADCDDAIWSAVDMGVGLLQLGSYIAYNEVFAGVAFESGGADYAEWLPKSDVNERLVFGEVVGVKGGEISKKFIEAEKFMVVSHAPAVIGGAPDPDKIGHYSKIAFMGQVSVKVLGETSKGDYILPSGNGDGMAMSVHPDQMKALDYSRVIGIAWSDSEPDKAFSYINTAVGINNNDLAEIVDHMQSTLNEIQKVLKRLVPDYQPTFYETSGNSEILSIMDQGFSQTSSLRSEIKGQMDTRGYSNLKEAMTVAKDYLDLQEVDIKSFPYLEELFTNPTAETAMEAQEHYLAVLRKLENMSKEMARRRN